MRHIEDSDLVGKTIKSIDTTCVNALVLTFSDDTVLTLMAEQAVFTNVGTIPGFFVDDNPDGSSVMVEVDDDHSHCVEGCEH